MPTKQKKTNELPGLGTKFTEAKRIVLEYLVEDSRAPFTGMSIHDATHVAMPSVYGIIIKMQVAGWITVEKKGREKVCKFAVGGSTAARKYLKEHANRP